MARKEIEKTTVILCSREGSSRLPGKVFRPIGGIPPILHIIHRLKKTGLPIQVAVPTGEWPFYLDYVEENGATLHEGNPESPLHRMADLTRGRDIKWIVRVTHDDILIDPETVLDLVAACEEADVGYGVSNGIVEGAGVEVIRNENLQHAAENRIEPTEFVSYFVRGPGMPYDGVLRLDPRQSIKRDYRLTLDYPNDEIVLECVLNSIGAYASTDEVCLYLDKHPHILNANRLPDVSFYTCAYNSDRWIYETMRSVLDCGLSNFEYIVVDDGSSDNTLSEISFFANDPRVKIQINKDNLGLSTSSNRAITKARGKWVMRIDADDLLMGHRVKTTLDIANQSDADIVYPSFYKFGGSKNSVLDDVPQNPKENHHAGGALMSRNFINELRFTDGLRNWDSLDIYNRAIGKGNIVYQEAPTWMYRQHQDSMSRKESLERISDKRRVSGGNCD